MFPTKLDTFVTFLAAFNARPGILGIQLITTLVIPSFLDHWLAGFTDSEGCFSSSLLGNSTAFRFRYLLSQLGATNLAAVLMHITTLIGGTIRPHSNAGDNELTVSGLSNMYRVFKYFDTHPLHTKKATSYKIWREVHVALMNKEHLSPESRALLKAKAATINK